DMALRKVVRLPGRTGAVPGDAPPTLIETEHRQRWDQHRAGEQEGRSALVERLHPEPEIKPDAAVCPGNEQDGVHQPHLVRGCDPVGIKNLRIELVMSEGG